MSPIETLNCPKLDILSQMAGEKHNLPPANWQEFNNVLGAGTAALIATGTVMAPASIVNPVKAEAVETSRDVKSVCIGPNTVQTTITLTEYPKEIIPFTWVGVSNSPLVDENNPPPELPQDKRTQLVGLLSPPPVEGEGAYNGSATFTSQIPNGKNYVTTYISEDYPDTPYIDRDSNVSTPLDCTAPADNPIIINPNPEQPLKILKPGLKLTTAKILPRNRNGKLIITSSLSSDSTCQIDGAGNGASKNPKLRKNADRIEVFLNKPVKLGKLPKSMIALNKGIPAKKNDKVKMVSIDVDGYTPGSKQVDYFNYTLVGKLGSFSARFIIAGSECSLAGATAKATSKSI